MRKACAICGDIFTLESSSQRICKKDHYKPCPICGRNMIWNTTRAVEPCSKECRREQTKRKNLAKYGVEHPMQSKEVQSHHRKAMLEKYGVESPLQSAEIKAKAIESNRKKFGTDWALGSKEVKEKAEATMIRKYGAATTLESSVLRKKVEQTCLEKYGFRDPLQNPGIRNKITNTNFLKYGVGNPMQNKDINSRSIQTRIDHYGEFWPPEIAEAAKKTFLDKYGVDNPSKNTDIQNKIKESMIDKYGENYGNYLLRNISHHVISNINRAFMSKLNEKGIEGEFEFKGIPGFSYDIVIENQKTLIEIDPTYTHNAIGNHWSDCGLPNDYHRNKSEAAKQAGYRCIHVFDWDDWGRIIDMLTPKIKVYARNCTLYKLQTKVAEEFLNSYHLQGSVRGQVLCLGLVENGELLQVMTFGNPRYNKNYYSELLRLCTKPGVTVVGGASKMFNFATKKLGLDEIISYCDLSKFNGDVYSKIGMKLVDRTAPQEIWSKNSDKITANLLRQRGFDQLFNTSFGKGTSNNELMLQDGWLPVYDCGQLVYAYSTQN